jgi:hypothetical protein
MLRSYALPTAGVELETMMYWYTVRTKDIAAPITGRVTYYIALYHLKRSPKIIEAEDLKIVQ